MPMNIDTQFVECYKSPYLLYQCCGLQEKVNLTSTMLNLHLPGEYSLYKS